MVWYGFIWDNHRTEWSHLAKINSYRVSRPETWAETPKMRILGYQHKWFHPNIVCAARQMRRLKTPNIDHKKKLGWSVPTGQYMFEQLKLLARPRISHFYPSMSPPNPKKEHVNKHMQMRWWHPLSPKMEDHQMPRFVAWWRPVPGYIPIRCFGNVFHVFPTWFLPSGKLT